jgi:hypothetical protein
MPMIQNKEGSVYPVFSWLALVDVTRIKNYQPRSGVWYLQIKQTNKLKSTSPFLFPLYHKNICLRLVVILLTVLFALMLHIRNLGLRIRAGGA